MKLSIKNIAITLGVAAGAAVAVVLTTKKLNHDVPKQSEIDKQQVPSETSEVVEEQEDILYV